MTNIIIMRESEGFLDSVVKNPPANAEDMGFIPGGGKIPHATE